jgi:hypothetical protein
MRCGRAAKVSTKKGVSFAQLRKLALALPGVEESTSYGTPAFKVGKKAFGLAHVRADALPPLIEQSWRHFAPKTLLATFDQQKTWLRASM